jgi:hypothetical protein
MTINYDDFFRILEEWKRLVDSVHSDIGIRNKVKKLIDNIAEELKKSKNERDCEYVYDLISELSDVKGISQYVKDSHPIVEEICLNRE